ncbi:MAG TPA: hypothetical protein VGY48_12545 [Vicinamibacterales bacterium]|nr:hypothetical protein [Vicinamibacterales bacterium]
MAKKTARHKRQQREVDAADRARLEQQLVLRRAMRVERQTRQLTRALLRLRERTNGDLFDFAVRVLNAQGFKAERVEIRELVEE